MLYRGFRCWQRSQYSLWKIFGKIWKDLNIVDEKWLHLLCIPDAVEDLAVGKDPNVVDEKFGKI
jgi:hypothetical protein